MCKVEPANQWGWPEILSNKANYLLEVLAWQNTKDGQKKHPSHRPELFTPDFLTKYKNKETESEAMTVEEMKEYLSKPRKAV